MKFSRLEVWCLMPNDEDELVATHSNVEATGNLSYNRPIWEAWDADGAVIETLDTYDDTPVSIGPDYIKIGGCPLTQPHEFGHWRLWQ